MIDVSLIQSRGKTFSVKTRLEPRSDRVASMKILYVFEAVGSANGQTYVKKKTVFDSEDGDKFNIPQNKDLFEAIVKHVAEKYCLNDIRVRE